MREVRRHDLEVPESCAGLRLDQALANMLPEYSRSRIKDWINGGRVLLNGGQSRPRAPVSAGDQVVVSALVESEEGIRAQDIPLDIVHADDGLIVINKPAGLVVHPGTGNRDGTLQNALLNFRPELALLPRAGIVHRLDKDTSGLMAVAGNLEAHTRLTEAIARRDIERQYDAVCVGHFTSGGKVDQPIGRHPVDRVKMAVRSDGRDAVTHYRVAERFRGHTLVRARLETGRTHQIRVHMAWLKHPLVGDPVYGGRLVIPAGAGESLADALRAFRRQALHACKLSLHHPLGGDPLVFEMSPPEDLERLIDILRSDALEARERRRD